MPNDPYPINDNANELAALQAKVADYERKEAEGKAELDAKTKAALMDAKANLEKLDADRTALQSTVAAYEKRDMDAAEAIIKGLPKEAKAKLDIVREKLSPAELLEYARAEAASFAPPAKGEDPDAQPPSIGRGSDKPPTRTKEYKPQYADAIGENLGRDVDHLKLAEVDEDAQGNKAFRLPMKTFRKMMNKQNGTLLTTEAAAKRNE